MPQVYFNIGQAIRSAADNPHEFTTAGPIFPPVHEQVEIELTLPQAQFIDPTRRCRRELYRSIDGVTWEFLAAGRFTGYADNVGTPRISVPGSTLSGYFLRVRILIGDVGYADNMNVGIKVHSRP